MCLPWTLFRRKRNPVNFLKFYECSCDLCGKNFGNMEELVVHMGYHKIDDLNRRLLNGYGTVRCNKCWKSFETVAGMYEHSCVESPVIGGLSPVTSSGSLSSVVVHE